MKLAPALRPPSHDAPPRARIVVDKQETQILQAATNARRQRRTRQFVMAGYVSTAIVAVPAAIQWLTSPPAPVPPPPPISYESVVTHDTAGFRIATPSSPSAPIYSKDGSLLAVASAAPWNAGRVTVIDANSGRTLEGTNTPSAVRELAWRGRDALLWTDNSGSVTAYDVNAKRVLWTKSLPGTQSNDGEGGPHLSVSPDWRWVAVGGFTGQLYVLDAHSGEKVEARHDLGASGVRPSFFPSGDLAILSSDVMYTKYVDHRGKWNQVDLLHHDTWTPLGLTTRVEYASGAPPAVSDSGFVFAPVAGNGGQIDALDVHKRDMIWYGQTSLKPLGSPLLSPDQKTLAYTVAKDDKSGGYICLYNAGDGQRRLCIETEKVVGAPVFSQDSRSIIVADNQTVGAESSVRVRIFQMDSDKPVRETHFHGLLRDAPTLSPDGRFLALLATDATHNDTHVYLWDVTQSHPTLGYTVQGSDSVTLRFAPDSSHLALTVQGRSADQTGAVYLIPLI